MDVKVFVFSSKCHSYSALFFFAYFEIIFIPKPWDDLSDLLVIIELPLNCGTSLQEFVTVKISKVLTLRSERLINLSLLFSADSTALSRRLLIIIDKSLSSIHSRFAVLTSIFNEIFFHWQTVLYLLKSKSNILLFVYFII